MSEACCSVPAEAGGALSCPRCNQPGQSVEWSTVAALTSGVVPPRQGFRLCREPDCEAVYFGDAGTLVTAADMTVVPGFKTSTPEGLVCYCFQHSRGDIASELKSTGGTTIPERITAEVKAGNCACEVRNPAGKCCLGDVQRAIQEFQAGA